MPIVLRAFPIQRPVEDLREFAASLRTERKKGADEFYKRYGISHETWHLQAAGDERWVISLTVIDNPSEAAPRYAEANTEFETWFKQRVQHLTGIDPSAAPLGPATEEIFVWSDAARPNTALL